MDNYICVDKSEALWAVKKAIKDYLGINASQAEIAILSRVLNSPAAAIVGERVIVLHGNIPIHLLPLALAHEELHHLIFGILKEEGIEYRKAAFASKIIDRPPFNNWLCESLGVKYKELEDFIRARMIQNLPIFWRILVGR